MGLAAAETVPWCAVRTVHREFWNVSISIDLQLQYKPNNHEYPIIAQYRNLSFCAQFSQKLDTGQFADAPKAYR